MPRGLTDGETVKATAFMQAAIPLLKKPYVNQKTKETVMPRGVHCVFSGLGTHFKKRFPEVDYTIALQELEAAEVIATIRCRGGSQVYLWDDKPDSYNGKNVDAEIDAKLNELFPVD